MRAAACVSTWLTLDLGEAPPRKAWAGGSLLFGNRWSPVRSQLETSRAVWPDLSKFLNRCDCCKATCQTMTSQTLSGPLTRSGSPSPARAATSGKKDARARLDIRTGRLMYVAYVASRRARAVRAKCSLAGLTTKQQRLRSRPGQANYILST